MKNTKKIITLALAAAMLSATGITAFAADPTTDVTYEVAPIYTVVIPESVTLGDTAVTEQISIYGATADDNVVIGKTQKVNVALTESANGFKVKTEDGDEVAYTVNDKNTVDDLTTVAECTAAEGKKNTDITFTKTGTAAYAGTYTDTLTFGISVENAAQANPYAANNVGDVVTFGSYDWYIIGKSDNGVTLLMKEDLMTKAYNDNCINVTWATCSLRTYLNGEFYNSFSDKDKAKIVSTHNSNLKNPDFNTSGGNDTEDYIYLLSIAEAKALDNSIRANSSWWWLRSPGRYPHYAAVVNDDGSVGTSGLSVEVAYVVRPTLNLEF